MKKYVKPELIYESFELSQQIAACDYDSKNTANDVGVCGFTGKNPITGADMTIFLPGNNFCTTEAQEYCYHGSTGNSWSIFNS